MRFLNSGFFHADLSFTPILDLCCNFMEIFAKFEFHIPESVTFRVPYQGKWSPEIFQQKCRKTGVFLLILTILNKNKTWLIIISLVLWIFQQNLGSSKYHFLTFCFPYPRKVKWKSRRSTWICSKFRNKIWDDNLEPMGHWFMKKPEFKNLMLQSLQRDYVTRLKIIWKSKMTNVYFLLCYFFIQN